MRASPLVVSDQAYTKLRANILMTPLGAPEGITVPGNSFLDDDLSNKGLLPVGLERWSRFYGSYTIAATKIMISPIFIDPSAGFPIQYGLYPRSGDSLATSDIDEIPEFPYSRYTLYRGPGQSKGQMLSNFMSTNKILGQKSPYTRVSDELTGDFSPTIIQDPSVTWAWNYLIKKVDGSDLEPTELQNIRVQTKITYYIRFHNRKTNLDIPT